MTSKFQSNDILAALLLVPMLAAGNGAPNLVSGEAIAIQHVFSDQPFPKWQNGFILARDRADNPVPQVYVFDRLGRLLRSHRVVLPDAERVILRDVAVSPKGTLAVTGSAFARDGAAATFIAWLDSAGSIAQVARTSPFASGRLCFADDETLWATGREYSPDYNSKPEYDVLRRYASDGRLLGSLLPRSTFPNSYRDPGMDALLICAGNRLAMYSRAASFWVEVSSSGEILTRLSAHPGECAPTGLALTSSGSVYLSAPGQGCDGTGPLRQLNRQSQEWTPVTLDGRSDSGGRIIGTDGVDLLVYRGRGTLVRVRAE